MPPKRNKRRPRAARAMQMATQSVGPVQPRARRRRTRRTPTSIEDGLITLSKTEILATIKLAGGQDKVKSHVDVVPDSFTFLKKLFGAFERVRWNRLEFYYKPAVGTTYGGLVTIGMDWDWSGDDPDREKISGFTPSQSFSAWSDTQRSPLVLAATRLQSRLWYMPRAAEYADKGPGKLCYAAVGTKANSDTVLGELWVRYSVSMHGTTA